MDSNHGALGHQLEFNYNINHPMFCLQHTQVFLLIAIKTVFAHYDRRMTIRETWGNQRPNGGPKMLLVFMFGASDNTNVQKSIERENRLYRDIVQEDFLDTEDNQTLKTAMAYKWASKHCPHAGYVLVGNDNIVLDLYKLIPYLKSQPFSTDKFTVCNVQKCCESSRMVKSRHLEYYNSGLRDVCSSDAYLAPIGVVDKLFQASLSTPRFAPDHAWMGIVAHEAGVDLQNTGSAFAGVDDKISLLKKFMGDDYVSGPVMIGVVGNEFVGKESTVMRHLWRLIQEHHARLKLSSAYHAQFPSKRSESGSVLMMAVSLMFVDLLVVLVIFFLIFFKRKGRRKN